MAFEVGQRVRVVNYGGDQENKYGEGTVSFVFPKPFPTSTGAVVGRVKLDNDPDKWAWADLPVTLEEVVEIA